MKNAARRGTGDPTPCGGTTRTASATPRGRCSFNPRDDAPFGNNRFHGGAVVRKTSLLLAAFVICAAATAAEGARVRFVFTGTVAQDQPWDIGSDPYQVGDRFHVAVTVDASTDTNPSSTVTTYDVVEAIVLVRGSTIKYFHWFQAGELVYHTVRFEEASAGSTHWDTMSAHIGTFSQDWLLTSTNTPAGTAFDLADPRFWDVTLDGFNTFTWREARGYSSAGFSPAIIRATDRQPGDFDGDLKSDVLWRHATRGEVWCWPMFGPMPTDQEHVRTVSDTDWEVRGVADHTGDGRADVLWRHNLTGAMYLWTMNGCDVAAETYVATVDPAYDVAGTGDYDGDGMSDILWRNASNGEVWIWLMNGAAWLTRNYVETVDPAYRVQGSGDLNADGRADIVWRHVTSGDVWAWIMDGAAHGTPTWVGAVADPDYQVVGVADQTGEGKADILWHHAARGEVWRWTMDGATLVSLDWLGTVSDANYRIVATGDYDGDGLADVLWHHGSTGEVWVWLGGMPPPWWVGTVPDVEYQVATAGRRTVTCTFTLAAGTHDSVTLGPVQAGVGPLKVTLDYPGAYVIVGCVGTPTACTPFGGRPTTATFDIPSNYPPGPIRVSVYFNPNFTQPPGDATGTLRLTYNPR